MRKVPVWAVIAAVVLSGCGGSKEQTGAPGSTAARRLRFMVIPKAIDLPVFNYAKIGAERQAKAYGDVDILWNRRKFSNRPSPRRSTASRSRR
jgi:ABC-type sugar transport system substrate-binding protein